MKKKFIIQDFPIIIRLFASVNPIHLFIYVIPVLIAINIYMSNNGLLLSVLSFALGAVYWTFLEYFIHRYIYHTNFKSKFLTYTIGSFHLYHHSNLKDHSVLNSGFLIIAIGAPIVTLPFFLLFSLSNCLSIFMGLVCAYYIYECVHYLIHYREYKSGYMQYIQKYHMQHHCSSPNKNFGNTSHFWDVLFGTYDSRYKSYKMSKSIQESLITYGQEKEQEPITD